MDLERSAGGRLFSVVIGTLDGRTHSGAVGRFSPVAMDVVLTLTSAPKLPNGSIAKMNLPAEAIAYVGFPRAPGEPPPRPESTPAALRVVVAGAKAFLVDPVASPVPANLGLYARPRDPGSPFKELFFYQHGINAKENNTSLGALLVQQGHAREEDIGRGLEAQRNSRVPIGQILVEHNRVAPAAIREATVLQERSRLRIGEVLVEAGLADPADIEFALAEQRKRGGKRLGQILVELNLVSEEELSRTLAQKFHLPFVDLDATRINLKAVQELPRDVIEKHKVLPVDTDSRTLTVALSDPLAVDTIDALRFRAQKRICEVVVTPSQLEKYIPRYLDQLDSERTANEMNAILEGMALDDPQLNAPLESESTTEVDESDSAVIKLANQLIIDAYRREASDIHVEPNGAETGTRIRFRVDGECVHYQDIPPAYRQPLVSRLKIMAKLDISERRKPQDGKIQFRVGDRQIELRVATIPTVNGNEDVVMRILAAAKPVPLAQLLLSDRNYACLDSVIRKPYGLVLCVGPTGSGKTTTLHSALGAINTVDTKIWTAEDPVEITQKGLRQVQVNEKIGFSFSAAMRAFLRADPDVIMVGEMRDLETASTAIQASLTGHLVLSTLHTNTAPETVTRLIDMGLDPFSFADALLGILAQRLARGLCKQCRELYSPTKEEMAELAELYGPEEFRKLDAAARPGIKLFRAVGCQACANTGYRGRIALHELLVTDDEIKRLIQRKAPVDEVRRLARAGGMTTLLQDGIAKVLGGHTDLKQVQAVCSR